MYVDDEGKCNLEKTSLINCKPNNAQNTQHKLGVAFSYLECNNVLTMSDLNSF